jgi:hypothetical protein
MLNNSSCRRSFYTIFRLFFPFGNRFFSSNLSPKVPLPQRNNSTRLRHGHQSFDTPLGCVAAAHTPRVAAVAFARFPCSRLELCVRRT